MRTDAQRAVLIRVHRLAGRGSLIPNHRSYVQQKQVYEKQTARAGLSQLHGLRHEYAQSRYQELTGWKAPAAGGPKSAGSSAMSENKLQPFISDDDEVSAVTAWIKERSKMQPRLLRLRDAPGYLGMDRNRFNAEVRPYVPEIPIGSQGIAFDRLDLDAWVDEYKSRNGRRAKGKGERL